MLNFETIESKQPADASIIFLHGLGANGFDLIDVVPMLNLSEPHGVRFIFPHAPSRPVTLNLGMEMPAWYDILGLTLDSRQDFIGLEESRAHIDALIEHEIARGIKPERIFLGGFSQGGALALVTGLQSLHPLAGLIILSSYWPCVEQTKERITPASKRIPIFMAHGTQDPLVMYSWGEISKNELLSLGFSLDWHSYPIAHEICPPELQLIGQFIQHRLK
jgi:phospholipase/carboxylesterase